MPTLAFVVKKPHVFWINYGSKEHISTSSNHQVPFHTESERISILASHLRLRTNWGPHCRDNGNIG